MLLHYLIADIIFSLLSISLSILPRPGGAHSGRVGRIDSPFVRFKCGNPKRRPSWFKSAPGKFRVLADYALQGYAVLPIGNFPTPTGQHSLVLIAILRLALESCCQMCYIKHRKRESHRSGSTLQQNKLNLL